MSDRNVIRCLFLLILLNMFDAYITATLVPLNLAKEVNPVMEYFLNHGVFSFIMVKVTAVSLACFVFWRYRRLLLAKIGLLTSLFVYFCLNLYFLAVIL